MRSGMLAGAGACTLAVAGYLAVRLRSEDRTLFLPGPTSHGHYQIELRCDNCHGGDGKVASSSCQACHREELEHADDSHPPSKFLDPRNAALIAKLDARECVACHTEHEPALTDRFGVSLPRDYCVYCHDDIGEERSTHAGLTHDSCQAGGCHNFHDNRALTEDFMEEHLGEPDLRERPLRLLRTGTARRTAKPLAAADADAPRGLYDANAIMAWAGSAHARNAVNCSDCHGPSGERKVEVTACERCHQRELDGFRASRHGARLAVGLSPMQPKLARLPMKARASERALDCQSCHGAHAYDTQRAAAEACQGCHDDRHTRAYPQSPHARAYEAELEGEGVAGSGVSCAACHLPVEHTGAGRVAVQHNQNDNLRPNEKMARSVCLACHGLRFTLDALADAALIEANFRGGAAEHVPSLDWVEARREARQRQTPAKRERTAARAEEE
jgi:hypothetical protein